MRDAQGWLAPPLPEPSTPVAPAVRPELGADAVVLDTVERRYGTDAVGSVGLPPTTAAFRRGGFHVVTGPSGSGKTTLLRLVAGLDRPTDGRVVTLGTDLADLDRDALARFRAARIGIVDQVRDLVPFLTARENVELGLAIRGFAPGTLAREPPPRSRASVWATTSIARPTGCPPARGCGWRSPARWLPIRSC